MNKYKLIILKIIDIFIRFMGLIGGFIIGVIGMLLGWWTDDGAIAIYVLSFIIGIFYCMKYNGKEWTV